MCWFGCNNRWNNGCNGWNNGCGGGCGRCNNNGCGGRNSFREGFRQGYWQGYNDALWNRGGCGGGRLKKSRRTICLHPILSF